VDVLTAYGVPKYLNEECSTYLLGDQNWTIYHFPGYYYIREEIFQIIKILNTENMLRKYK
jgi:hypothetical protein